MKLTPGEEYYIDEDGIYFLETAYGDEVIRTYVVNMDNEARCAKQFEDFIEAIKKEGASEELRSIKKQFKELLSFLS